jgi:predicted amidohydrolase YtcJ
MAFREALPVWPTKADLDIVESRRPVAISNIDGHSYWVNTLALEKIGYCAGTPDPLGGKIMRDELGKSLQ